MQTKTTYDPDLYVNSQYINQAHSVQLTNDQVLASLPTDLLKIGITKIHPLVDLTAIEKFAGDNKTASIRDCLEELQKSKRHDHIHPILSMEWYTLQLSAAGKNVDDVFSFFVKDGIYGSPNPHPAICMKSADRNIAANIYWSSEDTFLNHQETGTPASKTALDWLANHPSYRSLKSRYDILSEYLRNGIQRGDWWFNAEMLFGEILVDVNRVTFAHALRKLNEKE